MDLLCDDSSFANCYLCAAIAHASLAETLIKLNTGLVGIIAAFLNHDSKAHHLNLDYKSLTHLSDSSRAEAINSMNQLYQRLSQSQLQVYRIGACPRCGSSNHQNCSGAHSNKESRTSSRTRTSGPTVARIPVKSSSTTVLAVVRPRNARKSSSSSASSAKSQSTALNSPYASPLGSPLPQYAPKDPFPLQPVKKPQLPAARKRVDSHGAARPTTWPHTKPDNTFPLQAPPRPPKLPISKSPAPAKSPVLREKSTSPSAATPLKRRIDKATPSTYTFASDSTKLGEIPQRNWAVPFDYAEAERLNAEALVNGYPGVSADEKPKTKKGLFKFLRRGTAVSS